MSTNTALDKLKNRVEGHTEGPWDVTGMDSGHSRYEMDWWVTAGDGDTICDMDGLARSRNERVAMNDGMADAKLIAAAPKMLAALEAVDELAREAHLDLKQANEAHGIECHEKHSACLASLVLEAIEEALR